MLACTLKSIQLQIDATIKAHSCPQSFGVEVERVPTSCLMNVVNHCVQEDNMTFLHSYDDLDLIAGHARYTEG